MKQCDGVWLPDSERHLVKMLQGTGLYQYNKLTEAMKHVRRFGVAVDVGMHVGLWSMHLAKRFAHVIGFEPVPEHIECLRKNMEGLSNWVVHNCVLGDRDGFAGLTFLDGATASTHIDPSGTGTRMLCLDSFELTAVDFLKVDVEGYEYQMIQGGAQTIRKHRPTIIVEQKGGKHAYYGRGRYDAKELLESWGARTVFQIGGDFCLKWKK